MQETAQFLRQLRPAADVIDGSKVPLVDEVWAWLADFIRQGTMVADDSQW